MSTQNLKFIHLASNTAATNNTANAGAIIFEPKSGRIAVQGTDNLEYYGGGRIADATFDENKILTISFNNGDPAITLDFSDTASASGVNKVLSGLRGDVNTLKATVGDAGSGLVKDVADNKASISQNKLDIAANKDAIDKINNPTTGILAQAKEYTDTEISAIKGDGVAEGETLKKLRDSITTLEGKHAAGKTVADEIIDKVGAITGTVKDYVDVVSGNVTALGTRVGDLEKTVGDSGKGLVKDVTDLKGLHANKSEGVKMTVKEEVDAGIAAVVADAPEKFDTLKEIADWIGNDTTGAATMATDINDLKKKVGASTDTANADGSVYARIKKNVEDISGLHKDIADNKAAIADNTSAISTNTNLINANTGKITALEGLHADKSGGGKMTVDAEIKAGIAAIPSASLDSTNNGVSVTVSTKSGSVSGVTVDASGLSTRVGTLEGVVGSESSGLVKTVNTHTTDITNIKADLGTRGDGKGTAFARIEALEEKQADGSLMWSVWQD